MKKLTALFVTMLMVFSLSACQNQSNESAAEENTTSPPQTQLSETQLDESQTTTEGNSSPADQAEANNVLIAYFSLWGNSDYPDDIDATTSASIVDDNEERYGTTEYVARMIQENVGGDIHLIQTAEPYSTDFDEVTDQNHDEMDAGTLPELTESNLDISQYDTVFIGYPVWATNAPQAIFSFLTEYDMAGKTVVPFCTHDGYGAGGSYDDIAAAVPAAANVPEGLAIEAPDVPAADETVSQWLDQLGLTAPQSESAQSEGTPITITVGETVLEGVIYDTELANEIRGQFPLTVSMSGFGGREYYGGIDFTPANAGAGQLNFENGDITYCSTNNTMAIFYAQTDNPDLSMEVIPVGRVTSDLGIFDELSGSADITFDLAAEQQGDTGSDSDSAEAAAESNVLVAYFSWADNAVLAEDVDAVSSPSVVPTGDVAHLASWVQEQTGGDIFPIQVTEPYPSDWDECLSRANEEKAAGARPELTAAVENISDYDVVFLGYPNWWYSCPMAVLSFIEENDLAGKQVYLFCSHGTGGLASSVTDITAELPDSDISENVFDVNEEDASSAQPDIQSWLTELGY